MNYIKHFGIAFILLGVVLSCSNPNTTQTAPSTSEQHKEPADKQVEELPDLKTDEPGNKQTKGLPNQNATEPGDKQEKKSTDNKTKERPDKNTVKLVDKPKQAAAPVDLKAKNLADQQAKELAEKQAKDLADKQAKELADQKAKELAEKLAKEEADKIAKELADKKAKEQADKLAKELADKKAAEQASKQTEQKAKENAASIIQKVDKNMRSETQISTTEMVIYGKRNKRTIRSKGYAEGDKKSFSEYLSPAKEKGTKMLKLKDRLWIYSPDTDRSIQLSGHMLKQSVMGSDLSYEDMMEDRKLTEVYNAKVVGEETLDNRSTWVLELNAKVDDASYEKRKMWIDQKRYVPLKEELFAKSGQLLKKTTMSDITKIDGRWFPKKMNFKDMLKSGKGTDFIVLDIQFNPKIPAHIFSKASLKK